MFVEKKSGSRERGQKDAETKSAIVIAEWSVGGGAETFLKNILNYLVLRGFAVTVLPMNWHTRLPEIASGKVLFLEPITLSENPTKEVSKFRRRLRANPLAYFLESQRVMKAVFAKNRHWDLVVTSICSPGRLSALRTNGKAHFQFHHTYIRGLAHLAAGPLFGKMLGPEIRLIAVSPKIKELLDRTWLLPQNMRSQFLANGSGSCDPKIPRKTISKLEVLTVGELSEAKAPERIIEVAETLRSLGHENHFKFTLVGDGPLRTTLQTEVKSRNLIHMISIEGFHADTDSFYSRADAYLQLSRYDSLPYALLDAVRRGIPSVVTDVGGLPYIVGNIRQLVVESDSPAESVAKALLLLRNNLDFRILVHSKLLERYRDEFESSAWHKRLDNLFGTAPQAEI